MSFTAILHFEDLSIKLLESTINFKEEIDYNGCPSGPPRLTNVRCVAEATQDISLWEWAIANYKLMNLKLEYQPIRIDSKSRNYYFYDSNCHMYTEHYSHNGQTNYLVIIEFVAAIFKTDNLVLEKHWKVTDLNAPPPTTRTKEDPTILESYFENEDGEKIDGVKKEQEVYLVLKTKDMTGKSVDIDLGDHMAAFEYHGQPLENNVIKNHSVTADTVKIKLKSIKKEQS